MKEKSIYNMIIAILATVVIIPLLILGLVGQIHHGNHLMVILMSIFYPLLGTSFILKSIYYGKEEDKEPFIRISKVFLDCALTLITIAFLLTTSNPAKWVIFGFLIAFTLIEVVLDSINKGLEVKYLITLLKAFLFLFTAITLNASISLILVLILSMLLGFISDLLGNYLENKIILSYEIISLILFGIFLIAI